MLLGVLISVAFMILMERKVLGYIQLRKGPNKVGLLGIIQSFSDAIKLFVKEQFFPIKANKVIYYLSPVFSLFIILRIWLRFPKQEVMIAWTFSALFFFCLTRLGVYRLIGRGWASNSNYSLVGAIRGVAQTVSYEVSLMLIFISFLIYGANFSVMKLSFSHISILGIFVYFPLVFMWVISSLAETNRTPFDFSEGESELVSGFNIEYSSGGFALLFLGEYASIIFMRFLISLVFVGTSLVGVFYGMSILFVFFFIWVRSCYPRFRYDKLIALSWKTFLPRALLVLFYYLLWI